MVDDIGSLVHDVRDRDVCNDNGHDGGMMVVKAWECVADRMARTVDVVVVFMVLFFMSGCQMAFWYRRQN